MREYHTTPTPSNPKPEAVTQEDRTDAVRAGFDPAEFWAAYEEWADQVAARELDSAGQRDECPQFVDDEGQLRRVREPESKGRIGGIEI